MTLDSNLFWVESGCGSSQFVGAGKRMNREQVVAWIVAGFFFLAGATTSFQVESWAPFLIGLVGAFFFVRWFG